MSTSDGIPTYTSAPVNSNKEEGTHASISQPEPATTIESSTTATTQPANTSATATAPSYSPIYATAQPGAPPAQPGAAPSLPVPTGSAPGNLATPTTTLPTTTTTYSPPPPQPGAVPQTSPPATHSPVPPPPKAGEAIPSQPSAPAPQPSTTFTQSYSYQPSHSIPNSTSTPYSSVYQTHAGASSSHQGLPLHSNSGGGAHDIFQDDEPSFMNTAKSWMQSAGTKLAEVEAEVWKRINNAHDE